MGNRIDISSGKWIVFENCATDIEAHEVSSFFKECVGIEVEEERISIRPGAHTVLVSLSDDNIRDIMAWAFQDAILAGRTVCVRRRLNPRNQASVIS